MQLKFVILLTFLVCLSNNQVNLLNINGSFLDKAKECYDKLKGKIQQTIDECVGKLNGILIKTSYLADRSINDGTREIVKVTDEYTRKLDELINENTENKQCIENIQSKMMQLRDNTIDDLNKCIKDVLDQANINVDATIMKMNSTWDIVQEFGINLEACGNDSFCLSKMITGMVAESVRLPLKITGYLLEATAQLTEFDLKIGTCTMYIPYSMAVEDGKLFASTANCTHQHY